MKVDLTEEAKAQVRRRRDWWKKKREIQSVFNEELREARRQLKHAPKLAVHGMREGLEVRRINLSRIHCYIYYTIDETEGLVLIVSVWGQEMAHQPDFVDED
jgi:hypothetical protein